MFNLLTGLQRNSVRVHMYNHMCHGMSMLTLQVARTSICSYSVKSQLIQGVYIVGWGGPLRLVQGGCLHGGN